MKQRILTPRGGHLLRISLLYNIVLFSTLSFALWRAHVAKVDASAAVLALCVLTSVLACGIEVWALLILRSRLRAVRLYLASKELDMSWPKSNVMSTEIVAAQLAEAANAPAPRSETSTSLISELVHASLVRAATLESEAHRHAQECDGLQKAAQQANRIVQGMVTRAQLLALNLAIEGASNDVEDNGPFARAAGAARQTSRVLEGDALRIWQALDQVLAFTQSMAQGFLQLRNIADELKIKLDTAKEHTDGLSQLADLVDHAQREMFVEYQSIADQLRELDEGVSALRSRCAQIEEHLHDARTLMDCLGV